MKTIILMIFIVLILFTSCSSEDNNIVEIQYSNTENPEWVRNVYLNQEDTDKMCAFEQYQFLLDLTYGNELSEEYWLSYYFSFDNNNNWQPIKNYNATDNTITFSVDNQYYEKELFFTINRLSSDDIIVYISDEVNTYYKGTFIKQ